MTVCLSILRGINVSGQKVIKMLELKAMFEQMGFTAVTTYIQSGNVIFESKISQGLNQLIMQKIKETFSFDIPVQVFSKEELINVVERNPFLKRKNIALDKLHVTFLEQIPVKENVEKIMTLDYAPDEFVIIDKAVYLHCPNGYGKTKLHNNFFEDKLKVKATTRNWKTTTTLLGMMG